MAENVDILTVLKIVKMGFSLSMKFSIKLRKVQ